MKRWKTRQNDVTCQCLTKREHSLEVQDFRDASPKQGNNPEHFRFQEYGFQNFSQADSSTAKKDQLIEFRENIGSEFEIK